MPREATDLRERILEAAGTLFMQQGFAATSIKQIAHIAGCTTASLYYYFEGGKPEILRSVVQQRGQEFFQTVQQACMNATTLEEFLICLGNHIVTMTPIIQQRLNFLMLEAPDLAADEQQFFAKQTALMQQFLFERITFFLKDKETANALSWVAFCALFGYEQIELMEGHANRVPVPMTEFARTLARALQQTSPT